MSSLQYGLDQTWWCPGDVYGLKLLSSFYYTAIQYTIINAVYKWVESSTSQHSNE